MATAQAILAQVSAHEQQGKHVGLRTPWGLLRISSVVSLFSSAGRVSPLPYLSCTVPHLPPLRPLNPCSFLHRVAHCVVSSARYCLPAFPPCLCALLPACFFPCLTSTVLHCRLLFLALPALHCTACAPLGLLTGRREREGDRKGGDIHDV